MKKLSLITLAVILSLALCCSLTACSDKTVEQLKNESGALLEGGEFEKGSVLNFDTVDTTSENAEDVFEKLSGIGVEITDKSKAFIYDISVTKDGKEVQPNGKVKITVPMPQDSTETDYSVYHVKDNGEVVKIPSTYADGKLTFETDGFSYYIFVATGYINSNVTPAPVEVTLTATAGEGGSITEGYANGKKVEKGTSVTLTATPNTGYHFVGWYNGNNKVGENVSYTFTVNEDTTLSAKFEKDAPPAPVEVTLTATAGEGGSITEGYANGKKVEKGTSVTLTATPNTGYHFVGWYNGNNKVGENVSYTFTVNEDTTLSAKFEKDAPPAPVEVTLTATAGEGGSITEGYANGKKVEKGTSVTLTATPNTGYHFVGWYNGNNKVGENVSYTFTVNEDTTLSAKFEKDAPPAPVEVTLTEAEWNAAIAYWKTQTNVKVVERIAAPYDGDLGAQIMLYQFNGTAYSEDGYFEKSQASQDYKGKATYYVKEGGKYYRISWGYINDRECWVKSPASQSEYEGYIASTVYRLPNYVDVDNENAFDYSNFTYDATSKTYKNSDGNITFAFTFENNVLTKLVLTQSRASDSVTFVRTVTFGDAEVDPPKVSVMSHFATCVGTQGDNKVGGYITENGEQVDYNKYLEAGSTVTLTAVAKDGYTFKHWGTSEYNYDEGKYEFTVFSTEETYTVVMDEYSLTLYAVFEEAGTDS